MKNKKFTIGFFVLVLLALALWIFFFHPTKPEAPVAENYRKHGAPCPGETKTYVMKDIYMKGVIDPGQKFRVIYNYYDCHKVERNDLVYMLFSPAFPPLVRFARAVGGDKYNLKHDKDRAAWNILVNGDMVYSEVEKHQPYFFGADVPPTLSLYLKSRKDGLFVDEIIALASMSPGNNDSGIFGIVKYTDILGKVEKLDKDDQTKD